jgi:hypothetical protein
VSAAPPIPDAARDRAASAVPAGARTATAGEAAAAEVALAFDASLQAILFGPERRLAIVDGRIVGKGDDIKGARSRSRRTPSCSGTARAGSGA